MIVEKILEAKKSKMRQWPVNSNRASELGHPCVRYLYYNRTRWQEKALPDVGLALVFELGNLLEDMVLRDLQEAGIKVVEQQRPFRWSDFDITGHIDAKILLDGNVYPLEIKSASPWVFDHINSINDMLKSKYVYMKKYPIQMMLYLLMAEHERGVMLFKNKSTGQMKEVWVDLDYGLAEQAVARAEIVNKHLKDGTVPDPIEWDDDVCLECSFGHICTNERVAKEELEFSDDEELIALLEKYWKLKPAAKEYAAIEKAINEKIKGVEKMVVGDYLIEGQWRTRKSYNVPKEIKEKYVEEKKYWVKKITPLKGGK